MLYILNILIQGFTYVAPSVLEEMHQPRIVQARTSPRRGPAPYLGRSQFLARQHHHQQHHHGPGQLHHQVVASSTQDERMDEEPIAL